MSCARRQCVAPEKKQSPATPCNGKRARGPLRGYSQREVGKSTTVILVEETASPHDGSLARRARAKQNRRAPTSFFLPAIAPRVTTAPPSAPRSRFPPLHQGNLAAIAARALVVKRGYLLCQQIGQVGNGVGRLVNDELVADLLKDGGDLVVVQVLLDSGRLLGGHV